MLKLMYDNCKRIGLIRGIEKRKKCLDREVHCVKNYVLLIIDELYLANLNFLVEDLKI